MTSRNRSLLGVVSVSLAMLILSVGQTANAEPYKRAASGWTHPTNIDANADGRSLWITESFGKGTFGKSTSNTLSDTTFVSAGYGCGELPDDVFALKFQYLSVREITIYRNGDMLLADTSGPPNILCIGLSDMSGQPAPGNWAEYRLEITGGTGRFNGATGSFSTRSLGTPLPNPTDEAPYNAYQIESNGEINLNTTIDDDYDDDDD